MNDIGMEYHYIVVVMLLWIITAKLLCECVTKSKFGDTLFICMLYLRWDGISRENDGMIRYPRHRFYIFFTLL